MRCALAAVGFKNEDERFNKKVIIDTMEKYADKADIVVFGEAFLQGFYGANFDPEHDEQIAVSTDDIILKEISDEAERYGIAVSFGFIEKCEEKFFSSQITIDKNGKIIDLYRRVSEGWKVPNTNERYCEGKDFHTFSFMDKNIVVGLCGDLWFDENAEAINQLNADVVFWPVYTDYNYDKWNKEIKIEYAEQAGKIKTKVLYVNSYCLDKDGYEIARGGAAVFMNGKILEEIPSGEEGILTVEI